MKTKYSFLCAFLAVLILVSSAVNIFLPSEHNCIHEGCQLCQFISLMERLFKTILLFLISSFLYCVLHAGFGYLLYSSTKTGCLHKTPVNLHVKLSN